MNSAIARNQTHTKKNWTIELNRTFDFRTLDFCLGGSSYFSVISVFRNRTIPGEMASDALWVVRVVKGYKECHFDVKEGEKFKVLKKIGEKGRTFRVVNERGQLGHLQRELVASLWPVNASITVHS